MTMATATPRPTPGCVGPPAQIIFAWTPTDSSDLGALGTSPELALRLAFSVPEEVSTASPFPAFPHRKPTI